MSLIKITSPKIDYSIIARIREDTELYAYAETLNLIFEQKSYFHWDEIRFKDLDSYFKGSKLTNEEVWMYMKYKRKIKSENLPIINEQGVEYSWVDIKKFQKLLHKIDFSAAGNLFIDSKNSDKIDKNQLITRGIMEEAISSSQLEGAVTSRKQAKKLLREGAKPRSRSEQMIVNNYQSMKKIEENFKDQDLTKSLLIKIHEMVTDKTLDDNGETPRLRKSGEPIFVSDKASGSIYHIAPTTDFVEKELDRMIHFANNDNDYLFFIHPVIKAIILHFWIGYLHPFTDGNGRLARLIFYWYVLRKGYWSFAYLPMSKAIKAAPKKYVMSYVYSEQDDNDLTYFIDYNMDKIAESIEEFRIYIERKFKENDNLSYLATTKYQLKNRQIYLLKFLSDNKNEYTTPTAHQNIHQVSKATALNDLKDLQIKGFLISRKRGKNTLYFGTDKIQELVD
jgi:Fic family protein